MPHLIHPLLQIIRIACKEWKLLIRNPHGLAVLFLMPAAFVLVMSFTLKNTLISQIDLPKTGWVLEEDSPPALQWAREWHNRYGSERFASRAALETALKQRSIEAGVIVLKPWLDEQGNPSSKQVEIWLGNRLQPAVAAKLRAEITFSIVQAQLKIAAAQAGPFASILLNRAQDPDAQDRFDALLPDEQPGMPGDVRHHEIDRR